MQHSPNEIKDKLVKALDKENNVVDMAAVIEVVAILEKMPITKDELEKTRLGKYVNELRKKTSNESLAKRAKDLVRKWRKLIMPHDTGTILNGERPASTVMTIIEPSVSATTTTHLSGPGPGSGSSIWNARSTSKPASPATGAMVGNGRPVFRGKLSSPSATFHPHGHQKVASPGLLQCSSASTSPALVRVNNHNRPATPNAGGRSRCGISSQYPSPAGESLDKRPVHVFQPVSPASNSLGNRTCTPSVPKSPMLPAGITVTRDCVAKSLHPSSSSTPVSPQDAQQMQQYSGNHITSKRTKPSSFLEDSNSCCSPPLAPQAPPPGPALPSLANGVDFGDSLDSVPSLNAEPVVPTPHGSRSTPHMTKKRIVRPHRAEQCDVLKEKIASHLRTPKVKTTAELIEELKARNASTTSLLGDTTGVPCVPSPSPVTRTSSFRNTKATSPNVATRRQVLPEGDEDMARTKTELMEKFLTDTSHRAPSPGDARDPVDVIMESLPPVNAEVLNWESDEEEYASFEKPVTEEIVQRLHADSWEGVNGNCDNRGNFQPWNSLLEKESFNGDVLRILPYVDLD